MMLILFILALLLSFYLLAKIVDDYFVNSLDKIAAKLKMSHDAAGATLMAVGSSAPELFVALFAVFRPDENGEIGSFVAVGVANIVGSALFNLLAITGAAAIARKALVNWQPVVRDLFFYAVSILMLLYAFNDGIVSTLDAVLFIGIYAVYVVAVIYWRRLLKYEDIEVEEDSSPEEGKTETNEPKSLYKKIMSPIDFVIGLFFPPERFYGSVFAISILMIAGISWVLVESAVEIAHILDISPAIVAVTILAAGTSVPDMISSIVVSKQGRGGMALSNAVGSNIFDILIGLGLPFLIIILVSGKELTMKVGNLTTSVYFLLGSILVTFVLFILNKWVVGRKMGFFLLALYIGYVVYAIITIK